MDSSDGLEEERRLCYVGMTRAKERLFLTSAATRTLYGKTDYTRESVFMRELDPKLINGDAVFVRSAGKNKFGGTLDGSTLAGAAGAQKRYDPFKYAKRNIDKLASQGGAAPDLRAGDRINHAKFGDGTVAEIKGKVAVIRFDDGDTKKLAMGIAPIRKL